MKSYLHLLKPLNRGNDSANMMITVKEQNKFYNVDLKMWDISRKNSCGPNTQKYSSWTHLHLCVCLNQSNTLYSTFFSQPLQCCVFPPLFFCPCLHLCPLLSWSFWKRKIPDKDSCKKPHLLLVRAVENVLALLGLAPLSSLCWSLYCEFENVAQFKLDMCFADELFLTIYYLNTYRN